MGSPTELPIEFGGGEGLSARREGAKCRQLDDNANLDGRSTVAVSPRVGTDRRRIESDDRFESIRAHPAVGQVALGPSTEGTPVVLTSNGGVIEVSLPDGCAAPSIVVFESGERSDDFVVVAGDSTGASSSSIVAGAEATKSALFTIRSTKALDTVRSIELEFRELTGPPVRRKLTVMPPIVSAELVGGLDVIGPELKTFRADGGVISVLVSISRIDGIRAGWLDAEIDGIASQLSGPEVRLFAPAEGASGRTLPFGTSLTGVGDALSGILLTVSGRMSSDDAKKVVSIVVKLVDGEGATWFRRIEFPRSGSKR